MRRYHRLLALVLAAVLLLAGACARAQEQVQALLINVGKADAALFFLDDQRFLVCPPGHCIVADYSPGKFFSAPYQENI